eukprot:3304504-Pleurochrysis_carterae.AAC.1
MAKKSASCRGRWQYTRRSRKLVALQAALWNSSCLSIPRTCLTEAIDGEMADASMDKIFELPIKLPNLPPRTLDRVILAGHR